MPSECRSSKSISCAVTLADSKSATAQLLFPLLPPSKPDKHHSGTAIGLPALPARLQAIDSRTTKLGKC